MAVVFAVRYGAIRCGTIDVTVLPQRKRRGDRWKSGHHGEKGRIFIEVSRTHASAALMHACIHAYKRQERSLSGASVAPDVCSHYNLVQQDVARHVWFCSVKVLGSI